MRIPPQFNHRPIILFIFFTNIYCLIRHFTHAFPVPVYANYLRPSLAALIPTAATAASEAGQAVASNVVKYEIHRNPKNYLHGGLTIEFIGEKPFGSAWPFVAMDVAVFLLQLTVYSLNFSKNGSDAGTETPSAVVSGENGAGQPPVVVGEGAGYGPPEDEAAQNGHNRALLQQTLDELLAADSAPPQSPDTENSAATLPATASSTNTTSSGPSTSPSNSSSVSSPAAELAGVYDSYSGSLNVRNIEVYNTIARSWNSHQRFLVAHGGEQDRRDRTRRRRRRQPPQRTESGGDDDNEGAAGSQAHTSSGSSDENEGLRRGSVRGARDVLARLEEGLLAVQQRRAGIPTGGTVVVAQRSSQPAGDGSGGSGERGDGSMGTFSASSWSMTDSSSQSAPSASSLFPAGAEEEAAEEEAGAGRRMYGATLNTVVRTSSDGSHGEDDEGDEYSNSDEESDDSAGASAGGAGGSSRINAYGTGLINAFMNSTV